MAANNKIELDHYRLMGNSGLRVSPLCLGAMTFGTEWGWGADRDESKYMFDLYCEHGGNFIDTANLYTNGTSETWLGDFMKKCREELVLATKFTFNMREGDPNAGGNHRKNIVQSLEASLKRLKTDYVDLYWMHTWEFRTPIEETMRALDDLVRSGKILYVGVSDAPAWLIAQANTMAELKDWTPFVALQIEYSLIERTVERELMPMAQALNLGVTPWSPLAGGLLTGKYTRDDAKSDPEPMTGGMVTRKDFNRPKFTERNFDIIDELKAVAQEIGQSSAQVAVNWLLRKPGVTSPIIGARTVQQLQANLECLDFVLDESQLERLDEISAIDPGFPNNFLHADFVRNKISGGTTIED